MSTVMTEAPTRREATDSWLRRHFGLVLVALIIALVAQMASEHLIGRLRAQAEAEALARAEVGAGVVQQLVIRRIEAADVLHRLAQSWFALTESGNREGAAALEEHLAATANSGSFGFGQVALIGADGWMEWSSISRRDSRVQLGDREHFRVHAEGRQEMFISAPVLGRVSNRWTVQLTRPLHDSQGRFGGVVVVTLDALNLSDALTELHHQDSERSLVLRDAEMIAAGGGWPESRIAQQLPAGDLLRQRPADRQSGAMRRPGLDGRITYAGWRALPGTKLTAAYILDAQPALLDATFATSVRLVAFGVGLIAMAGAVIVILARERRRARQEWERAENRRSLADAAHRLFERRVASLPAVVFGGLVAPEGGFTVTHVSESLARITGWTRAQLPDDQPWMTMSIGAPDGDHLRFRRQVIAAGQGTREFPIRRPDGSPLLLREHLRVVERLADGATEVVGYLRDVTAERDIEAKAQSSARLATLGEMAAGLAHELNQPLAVMSLAADNAARGLQRRGAEAIPDALARLDRIGVQGRRARDIVDHLRLFGRPIEDAPPEPVRLSDAIEGATVLTRAALRAADIALEVTLPADLPAVMCRLIPFEQTLVNILLNARDAIEERRPVQGLIRILGAQRPDGLVEIAVTDNGGGIPEAVMPRLFEPFFTTKPPGKGTGLGLPICHAAMRSFDGSIEAANTGEGACFRLLFQAAPVAAVGPELAV